MNTPTSTSLGAVGFGGNPSSGGSALFRLSRTSFSQTTEFSSTQAQIDGGVTHFLEESARVSTFAALVAGGGASRLARGGILALGANATGRGALVVQGFASLGSLGAEVVAFEGTSRAISSASGEGVRNSNLWRWHGDGGFGQGFYSSFITFGSLRFAGWASQGQNFVFQHAAQSSAMVAGHNFAGALHIIQAPEESLAMQFFEAERTNISLGAGMAFLHSALPGLHAWETSLDRANQSRRDWTSRDPASERRNPFSPEAAAETGNLRELEERPSEAGRRKPRQGPIRDGILEMTMGDPKNPGGGASNVSSPEGRPIREGESAGESRVSMEPLDPASVERAAEVREQPSPRTEGREARVINREDLAREEKRVQEWMEHNGQVIGDFYQSHRDYSRLHDAITAAHSELQSKNVNRAVFLSRVMELLKRSEWERGARYSTPYSVVEGVVRLRRAFYEFLSELAPELGLTNSRRKILIPERLHRTLTSYNIDRQGGFNWGVRVEEGVPREALRRAFYLIRDSVGYSLGPHESNRDFSVRLAEARQILRDNKVRLVVILGAGRHGLALGDWVRMAAGTSERVGGESVIPLMLGRRLDFVYELNVQGTYAHRLPDRVINSAGRLGLKSVHPRMNEAYLALADTVITTLDSKNLEGAVTPELIRRLSPHATVIPAIKSVMESGESVPEWFLTRLAREGRFDLMNRFILQSGLGFPREMMGGNAPEAPVNLRLDAMSKDNSARSARLLVGDRSSQFISPGNGEIYRAANRSVEVSHEIFVAAYWGFIKNFIAPWVAYRFQQHLIREGPRAKPQNLSAMLDSLVREALQVGEETFFNHELPALRRGIQRILSAMDEAKSSETVFVTGSEYERDIRNELAGLLSRDESEMRQALTEHTTGIEDLLGCTRIRDMSVYQRVVWDLLLAKGDSFERQFSGFPSRVKSQASSQNFAFALLEPIIQHLWMAGMILKRPNWNFTVEGITGLPHAERRWEGVPPFVQEILEWLPQEGLPLSSHIDSHPSGMRHHALDVARDRIKQMEDQLLSLRRTKARRKAQIGPKDLMIGFEIGHEIVKYLRQEQEMAPPRNPEDLKMALNELENGLFRLEGVVKKLPPAFDPPFISNRLYPFLDQMQDILVELRKNFDAQGDLTHWRENQRKIFRLFLGAERTLSRPQKPSRPPRGPAR